VTDRVEWTTDDPMVASVSKGGLVTGVGQGATVLRARLDGQEAVGMVLVRGAAFTQLSVSPINPSRRVGEFVQFGASAIRSDNTSQNVTNMATWTSSDPSVANVSNMMGMGMPRGRATCRSEGKATITATYMGLSDSSVLTCLPQPTLVAVQVTPFLASILVGQNQPFQATALFSDGTSQTVNMMATWTSSAPMVADVTNLMMRGLVTGISAGTATITATYQGMSGSAQVTVSDATVVAIMLSPPLSNLKVGQQQQLMATAIYSDNTVRNVTPMTTFTSADPSIAAVSNAGGPGPGGGRGQVTALKEGSTTISGTFMGFSDTITVNVTAPKITMLQVTPVNPTLLLGELQQLQAVAIYDDFTTQMVTGMATWQSKDPMVAAVSTGMGRGTVTALAAGTTTIIATYMGVSGTTVVTVSSATIKEIQVTPVNPKLPSGITVNFTAIAILSDGTQRNVTGTAVWISIDPNVVDVVNTGGRGVGFTLQPGTTRVQAIQGGVTGVTVVTVGPQQLTGITVTPAMASIAVGATQQYTATGNYDDGSTYPLTPLVTWISTDPQLAAISNAGGSRGLATGVAPGSASIEAHFSSKVGTAALTVTP
jgi:trimeric autotransporter adhesin